MSSTIKRPLACAVTALQVAFLVLGMLSMSAVTSCALPAPDPIRIGINRWPGDEYLFLAHNKGFYAAEGANVRILEFSSLGDLRRAYEHGQIDAASVTLIELLQIRDRTPLRPEILLVQDASNGGDVVLARSDIPDVAALKGRKVGVEAASLSMFMLERALDKAGLTLSDITTVPMDQSSMAQSMLDGIVDAVVTYPPAMNEVQARNQVRTLFTSADIPGEVVDIVAAERSLLETRTREVKAIVRAWDRAVAFARAHPDEAHPIMAAREQLSLQQFRIALAGVQELSFAEQRDMYLPGGALEKSLQGADRVLRRAREIAGPDRTADCIPPAALRSP